MKAFNIIFCILFLISAGLQYNDPDPYLWIPIYLYGAFLCFKAYQGKYYPKAYIAGIVVSIAYGVYLFFDKYGVLSWLNEHNAENIAQSMQASAPWIEETREFFGLLILVIVLLINYTSYRRKKNF
ncbi:transmembrane 220 family protein [Daejeonella lutea]|uniref:Transmembrane family 220, helix n=1 Tax=Daejeonella lutea TaxID=572036 RepID=A0A1T5ACH0_9SPHI|nr:transmembrane 220 family protein [Daejeonella lutea]SKB32457.1 Transmembrane family 220, helix [Daejeonella lutea]